MRAILKMKADGERIADIARALGISRPTIYAILKQEATESEAGSAL
ncbi:MAG: helix-turn-helix domain-containing protein [Thermoguttaceae bacterium]